jgi:rare lipoprotein A
MAVAAAAMGGCATSQGASAGYGLAPSSSGQPMFPESKWGVSASRRVTDESEPVRKGGGTYKVGEPYKVGGRWYNPREQPDYDRIGIASWYGSDFHGRHTANGEVYDMQALTAAHPTLPLPSYAYVTNLANGRTILVRVNDRGPYVGDRMIDLSKGSAHALGLFKGGTGRVRVRYAGPAPLDGNDSRERQFLASRPWSGGTATASLDRAPAPPLRESWQRTAALREPSGWPAPERPQIESVADAGPVPGGAAWSPFAYRQSLAAR